MRSGIRLFTFLASALALALVAALSCLSVPGTYASARDGAGAAKAGPCAPAARDDGRGGADDRDDDGDEGKDGDDDEEDDDFGDFGNDDSDDDDFGDSGNDDSDDDDFGEEDLGEGDEEDDFGDDDFGDDPLDDETFEDGDGSGERKPCRGRKLDPPAKPRFGKRLNSAVENGAVRVKLPGARRFVALTGAASVPVGSAIDARRGEVRLTSAPLPSGRRQSAVFSKGIFKVVQRDRARRLTELRLVGPAPAPCASKVGASRTQRSRGLWGRGKGRFRTRGRHGAATVRGTVWRTIDRCDGTLVIVRRGAVDVRDFARRRTVTVRAGHRYLARSRRR